MYCKRNIKSTVRVRLRRDSTRSLCFPKRKHVLMLLGLNSLVYGHGEHRQPIDDLNDLKLSPAILRVLTNTIHDKVVESYGQTESCSRPVKSSRAGRYQIDLPCREMEHGSETWCNLPGSDYPWHAVRRFVFENQGLMRRMYGEVRQLSVLRMEFSGETNFIEDSRKFDEIFKPVTITPTMANFMSTGTSSEPVEISRAIISSSDEIEIPGLGSGEEPEQLTTIEFKTTTEDTTSSIGNNIISNETGIGTNGDDSLSTGPVISGGDQLLSTDEIPTETTTEGIFSSENNSTSTNSIPDPEEEKNRIEGQILFQDFDRSSSISTTEEPKVRANKPGVNACPVKEEVVAPYWANNTRGEILALLNLYPFEQYIHWEKCTNEHRQMYCRDGCRCEQQYRLHRLLAFDPHNECRGIFSDWFKFPSCCICKCYFDEFPPPERVSFNRSPRIMLQTLDENFGDSDEPDVNGVDDSHFYYKYSNSFRQPRK